jgi:hypothetical protein
VELTPLEKLAEPRQARRVPRPRNSGRSSPAPTRASSVSGRARSQITVPLASSRSAAPGSAIAPPPRATTSGRPARASRAARSRTRKPTSPSRSKISAMLSPAPRSTSASASTKPMPSLAASAAPTTDFPAPIIPTSQIVLTGVRV